MMVDMEGIMASEFRATAERQARTIARQHAELAQYRAFLRCLLDDAQEPADLHGLGARIRTDVPRLLSGEIGPSGEITIG